MTTNEIVVSIYNKFSMKLSRYALELNGLLYKYMIHEAILFNATFYLQ